MMEEAEVGVMQPQGMPIAFGRGKRQRRNSPVESPEGGEPC